jgi:F420-dependent methylenetetrahydromethanopterin dehydrogenase
MQNKKIVICDADLIREYGEIFSCLKQNPDMGNDSCLKNRCITLYNFNCIKILEVEGVFKDETIDEMINNFNENFKDLTMKKHLLTEKSKIYLYIIKRN